MMTKDASSVHGSTQDTCVMQQNECEKDDLLDLESLVELELDCICAEPQEVAEYDSYISLEALALQSPHGGTNDTNNWNEDEDTQNNNDEENDDVVCIKQHGTESGEVVTNRRRLSLRKELFHQRIKSHDISSPGQISDEHYAAQPEFDSASPLLQPSSPLSAPPLESLSLTSNDNNESNDIMSKQQKAQTRKSLRNRKAKHGGIYTLLLKGLRRTDDDVIPQAPSSNNTNDEQSDTTKRGSPVQPVNARHGGIYRMLREKT
ncbi:hypothetical protein THRCLA_02950 [Thraustotheca clavata]|uniref:Uncharacterized protein n=1 Tax=Thraustotheca clavata TaxID=74557 RepID=A0A1W0A3I7_9STRA|nr:hypothetical protein THRCLA_02950 [Thraustotheca clavata]